MGIANVDKIAQTADVITKLMKAGAYLDVFGAKMIDDGNKEQAIFCAKVLQTINDTINFLAENEVVGRKIND